MTGSDLRAVVVPPVPALLPERAGLADPVADLRAACEVAVGELVADATRLVVLHDPLTGADRARGVGRAVGARVAGVLLERAGWRGETAYVPVADGDAVACGPSGARVLVMASGSARRHEKAPGHLDERSFGFDGAVGEALASGDPTALAGLDAGLGDELLAAGVRCLRVLGRWLAAEAAGTPGAASGGSGRPPARGVRWTGDPWGVQYWVAVLGPGARATD